MTEQRLVELETRVAYQDETLRVLSDALAHQQKRIEQLEQAQRLLLDRLHSIGEGQGRNTSAEEVPPHY